MRKLIQSLAVLSVFSLSSSLFAIGNNGSKPGPTSDDDIAFEQKGPVAEHKDYFLD